MDIAQRHRESSAPLTPGARLSGAGIVALNGNTLTVGGSNNLSSKFDGSISDGTGTAGSGGLIKAGTGTFSLSRPFQFPLHRSHDRQRRHFASRRVANKQRRRPRRRHAWRHGYDWIIRHRVAGTNVSPGDSPGTTGSLTTGSMVMTQGGAFNVELGGTGPGQFDQLVIPPTGTIRLNTGGMGGGGLGGVGSIFPW